jgi:hypothetical protein
MKVVAAIIGVIFLGENNEINCSSAFRVPNSRSSQVSGCNFLEAINSNFAEFEARKYSHNYYYNFLTYLLYA